MEELEDNEYSKPASRDVDPLFEHVGNLFLFGRAKSENFPVDFGFSFEELIITQALVMSYARIDAFINDSLRIICTKKPEIMIPPIEDVRENKSVQWAEIIRAGNYDELITKITDEFLYKLGLKSIVKRVDFLNNKLGLNIDLNKNDILVLLEGEQYRHCIVHRGGIVDKRLEVIISKEDVLLGSKLEIDYQFLLKIYDITENLIASIGKEMGMKFFKEEFYW